MSRAKQDTPKRRAWGGGTISERSPGQWVIRLSGRTDPMTVKRTRETRVVRGTRRQAESELRKLVTERAAHGPSPTVAASLTLDAWVRQHIRDAELSERTRRTELDLWERYSTPVLRATPLRDVTTAALDAHMTALRGRMSAHTKRPLSPRTRQLYFNVIRASLAAAVRTKRLAVNPATGIEVKGGNGVSKASAALTPDEMDTLLAHTPEEPAAPALGRGRLYRDAPGRTARALVE